MISRSSSQSIPSGSSSHGNDPVGTPLRGTPPQPLVQGSSSRSGSTERRRPPAPSLTLMPSRGSSMWDFTDGVPPITMEGWAVHTGLSHDEMASFQASADNFLKQLTQLSEADKALIPAPSPAPPATRGDRAKAIAIGGMAAYGTSFLFGKLAQSYLNAMVHPAAGAAAFVVIAGLFNALFSEAAAGGVRSNWGTYTSPDGAAAANYTTLMARMSIARAEGDHTTVTQCEEAVKKIVDGLIARVTKARADGHPIYVNIESMPVFSAWLRSFLSDELPFYAFSLMYLFSGAAMPYERAALIGPGLDDKAAFATADFFSSFFCGMGGGMGTVLGHHLLRPVIQRAPEPTAGLHTTWQDDRARSFRLVQLYGQHLGKAQQIRQSILDAAKAHPNPAAALDAAQAVLARVDKAIGEIAAKMSKYLRRVEKLRTPGGRDELQTHRNLNVNLKGGAGKTPQPLIEGAPLVRRAAAKALGNMLALAPFGFYLYHLAGLAEQALPEQPRGFPGNGTFESVVLDPMTMANDTVVAAVALQQGIQSLVGQAMASGTVLITSWICRTPLHHLIERGMGAAMALSIDPLYAFRSPAGGGTAAPPPPPPDQPDDTLSSDDTKATRREPGGMPRRTTVVDVKRAMNTPPGKPIDVLDDTLGEAMGALERMNRVERVLSDEKDLEMSELLQYLDQVIGATATRAEYEAIVVDGNDTNGEPLHDWGSPSSPGFAGRVRADLVRASSTSDVVVEMPDGLDVDPMDNSAAQSEVDDGWLHRQAQFDTDSSSETATDDDGVSVSVSATDPVPVAPPTARHSAIWGQTMLTETLLTSLIDEIKQMERRHPDPVDQ